MFFKWAGWLAVLIGVLWAVYPNALRDMLVRRIGWKLSGLLLALLVSPAVKIGSTAGMLGILFLLVLLWMGLSKGWGILQGLFGRISPAYYRAAGVLTMIWGLCVIRLK